MINSESAFRSGFITVIGKPNVGKSTIINSLLGEKVAITSPKPQTTRSNLRAIITEPDYQMIFIDTPGIHTPKNKLGEYMVASASATFGEVDVIVMVCDATDRALSQNDVRIIEKLKAVKNKPVFLAINKNGCGAEGASPGENQNVCGAVSVPGDHPAVRPQAGGARHSAGCQYWAA